MKLLTGIQIKYDGITILEDRHISLIRHAFSVMEKHNGCQTYKQGQGFLEITPGNT